MYLTFTEARQGSLIRHLRSLGPAMGDDAKSNAMDWCVLQIPASRSLRDHSDLTPNLTSSRFERFHMVLGRIARNKKSLIYSSLVRTVQEAKESHPMEIIPQLRHIHKFTDIPWEQDGLEEFPIAQKKKAWVW